jgi:mannose-6-phosphate isomerase-like protein (cupin superfamily)
MNSSPVRKAQPDFRWDDVEVQHYQREGPTPHKELTRQVLFQDAVDHREWRYFEVAAGGHSTLERHEHDHAVMILRGHGRCLVGRHLFDIDERDLISVPAFTWYQFRAPDDGILGFLCLVSRDRDHPQLPGGEDLAALKSDPGVAGFIRV